MQPDGATDDKPAEDDTGIPKRLVPIEDDVMQLARLGELGAIQKLFDSGKCDATYRDEQGITPLHVQCPSCSQLRSNTD